MIYNLEDLKKACDAGQTFKYLFFWGHTPAVDGRITEACFSQWWPCRFVVEGVEYTCAEQFMMAEKARLFGDGEMLEKIMEAVHPKEMKAYGRAVRGFDEEVWNRACREIVRCGNLAKFSQNPELWEFLKGTRKRILVEASPRDRIWGIGMGRTNPDAQCPLKWKGTNLLGFVLTQVRDELLEREQEPPQPEKAAQPGESPQPKDHRKQLRDRDGLTEEEFLAAYKPGDYPRPSVATDMVIFTVTDEDEENYRKLPEKELRVLLIRRGGHPYLGWWALPGGFVRPTETTEDAAKRELREETGVDQVYLEQLYTFSQPGRDPRTWVMSCSYMALIDSTQVAVRAGDDAEDAAWFKLTFRPWEERPGRNIRPNADYGRRQSSTGPDGEEVPEGSGRDQGSGRRMAGGRCWEMVLSHETITLRALLAVEEGASFAHCTILENQGLAFDHARILAYGLERLRGKLQYTDLAFHLMPEHFTLRQLQQVYEVVLDRELPTAAFRRKMAALVEETEQYTCKEGHRPSRLYKRS